LEQLVGNLYRDSTERVRVDPSGDARDVVLVSDGFSRQRW